MSRFNRGVDVDAGRFPHLHRMQLLVDEMAVYVRECEDAGLLHLLTWWRAKRKWKVAEKEWKQEYELAQREVRGGQRDE